MLKNYKRVALVAEEVQKFQQTASRSSLLASLPNNLQSSFRALRETNNLFAQHEDRRYCHLSPLLPGSPRPGYTHRRVGLLHAASNLVHLPQSDPGANIILSLVSPARVATTSSGAREPTTKVAARPTKARRADTAVRRKRRIFLPKLPLTTS